MENRKINPETNSHGNKLSMRTMLFTNSFTSDNNLEQRTFTNPSAASNKI